MNNEVTITIEEVESKPWAEGAEHFALSVLDKLGKHHWDLSVFFFFFSIIQKLNNQYRNLDESTDVLSFMMGEMAGEQYLPGDIVISLEKTEENAQKFSVSPKEELHRLLVHGILHLSGMDHSTNDKTEPMLVLQEQLLEEIKGGE
jgi:probable rRNA maturation factor